METGPRLLTGHNTCRLVDGGAVQHVNSHHRRTATPHEGMTLATDRGTSPGRHQPARRPTERMQLLSERVSDLERGRPTRSTRCVRYPPRRKDGRAPRGSPAFSARSVCRSGSDLAAQRYRTLNPPALATESGERRPRRSVQGTRLPSSRAPAAMRQQRARFGVQAEGRREYVAPEGQATRRSVAKCERRRSPGLNVWCDSDSPGGAAFVCSFGAT